MQEYVKLLCLLTSLTGRSGDSRLGVKIRVLSVAVFLVGAKVLRFFIEPLKISMQFQSITETKPSLCSIFTLVLIDTILRVTLFL